MARGPPASRRKSESLGRKQLTTPSKKKSHLSVNVATNQSRLNCTNRSETHPVTNNKPAHKKGGGGGGGGGGSSRKPCKKQGVKNNERKGRSKKNNSVGKEKRPNFEGSKKRDTKKKKVKRDS